MIESWRAARRSRQHPRFREEQQGVPDPLAVEIGWVSFPLGLRADCGSTGAPAQSACENLKTSGSYGRSFSLIGTQDATLTAIEGDPVSEGLRRFSISSILPFVVCRLLAVGQSPHRRPQAPLDA